MLLPPFARNRDGRARFLASMKPADPKGRVRLLSERILAQDWSILKKVEFEYLRGDGSWQKQTREVYDRGHGAVILLYQKQTRRVVLTRQFRLPVFLEGESGFVIEAAAGVLDDSTPEERIRAEAEEETGYCVPQVRRVCEAYMSPGSMTERLSFFVAEYDPGTRRGAGGGLHAEGEDIEVLELDFDQAFAMIASGEIRDAKTILLLQHAKIHLF